jgi:PhoPQ-activated pathogenicity-related protein
MTKAAVRAMDAVQAAGAEHFGATVENFVVTGASKRGWTTWLTAAVDRRVKALAPMVIDVLNMGPQMRRQLATWGKFSEQIEDYTARGLQRAMLLPQGRQLLQVVDPYAYRNRLQQPKLIILGTNDRYWPLDALGQYWDGLASPKHVVYVPNNGHGIKDLDRVVGGLSALTRSVSGGPAMPDFSWNIERGPSALRLALTAGEAPKDVRLWKAAAPTLDFREAQWTSTDLSLSDLKAVAEGPAPDRGHVAYLAEARFDRPSAAFPLSLSTNVTILPGLPT